MNRIHITNYTRVGRLVFVLHGELSMGTVSHFTDVFSQVHEATGSNQIVLDMAEVPLLDSCGLGALISAQRSVQSAGGEILLAGVRAGVMEMLRITKLDSRFRSFESVDEALQAEAAAAGPEAKG